MSIICVCTILPTLTVVGCMLKLYHAASSFTFAVTASILLIPFAVYLEAIPKRQHSSKCLQRSLWCSLFYIGLCLLTCLIVFGFQYGYETIICTFKECCTDSWIAPNVPGLSLLLHEKVFGQHLAIHAITKLLKGHVETNPEKSLVLSLHGLSGAGKSYITHMVVENMYVRGTKSKYVHYISATNDLLDYSDIDEYKVVLKSRIETAVEQCPRSFFIFDKMEKMPHGLMDTLETYMDVNDHVKGVDYRQSIFFLLSNIGDKEITKYVLQSKAKGALRKQLALKDLESVISEAAYNKPNGLLESTLISNNLISTFVPFLPLERKHVKQCIAEEILAKDLYKFEHQADSDDVDIIAEELEYFPNDTKLFSKSGCKRVDEKVKLYF